MDQLRDDDRTLVLRPMPGKTVKNGIGLVDPRLFSGENNMHAIKESLTGLWYVKYESGGVPPVLKQKWTGFNALYRTVEEYMNKRNIIIESVIDNEPEDSHSK
jgi:hypothetical protein